LKDSKADSTDAIAEALNVGKVSAAPDGGGGADQAKAKEKEKRQKLERDVKELDEELKKVGEVLNDPAKFAREKLKRGVPSYSDSYPQVSEEEEFWDDLKTGTEKAKEYIEYINKAASQAVNASDLTGLERFKKVAQGLKDLTEKLNKGLDKFGKRFKQLKQVTAWYGSMKNFAQASLDMDPRKRETVKPWVDSMQRLMKDTEPFIDWVQDKLKGAGGAVFSIVVAQLRVGLAGLDAGVKVVNAYLDRYKAIMQEIERQSGGWGPPKPPPPPEPHPWKSRAERAGEAKVREMTELVDKVRQERDFKARQVKEAKEKALKEAREAYDRKHKAAIDDFNNNLFPKIYLQHRAKLRQTILTNLRKRKDQPSNGKWLECLTTDEPARQRGKPDEMDPQAGIFITPTLANVNGSQAREEVVLFLQVKPPFPDFTKLHGPGLEKHLAKVAGPFQPPE
jgi:hypothetical protein